MIVYVTTADTEILALSRAVRELPDDFPRPQGHQPKPYAGRGDA